MRGVVSDEAQSAMIARVIENRKRLEIQNQHSIAFVAAAACCGCSS